MIERECPFCPSALGQLSHRQGSERLISLVLPIRPFRCKKCGERFWARAPKFFEPARTAVWLLLGVVFLGLFSTSRSTRPDPAAEDAPGQTETELRRQLEEAETSRTAVARQLEEAQSDLETATGESAAESELATQLAAATAKIDTLQQQLENLRTEVDRQRDAEAQVANLLWQLEKTQTAGSQLVKDLRNTQEQLEASHSQRQDLDTKLAAVTTENEDLRRRMSSPVRTGDQAATAEPPAEPTATPVPVPSATAATVAVPKEPATVPDEEDVLAAVRRWSQGWSAQQAEVYLASYSSEFRPARGVSRSAWQAQRRQRISAPSFIKVTLDEITVMEQGPDQFTVSFTQTYESNSYSDTVNKRLVLVLEGGEWKILREESLQ